MDEFENKEHYQKTMIDHMIKKRDNKIKDNQNIKDVVEKIDANESKSIPNIHGVRSRD